METSKTGTQSHKSADSTGNKKVEKDGDHLEKEGGGGY